MLIFAIDDEPKMLRLLHKAIEQAAPQARIEDFSLGAEAVRAVEAKGLRPDFVFSDIEMPGLDGLRLAVRFKDLVPPVKIVFVTGYRQYAYDAMQMHASGYIMKPVSAERVLEELRYGEPGPSPARDKLRVQCFGYFEVFWQDKPLIFERRKTKELLAYLVDREGTMCTMEEIATALWEGETDMGALKHRLRQLVSDLKNTLTKIGQADVIVRRNGRIAIVRERLDCDFYHMLDGDMDAVNRYYGSYMSQYSWAEITEGRLYFNQHRQSP